ncbi:DUF817 domain-containing protein [Exiguobacterium sp. s63]|uniref:DUF817 domain-containing protein n=1 Tax=Exiguobacterium sp. s63 TaxID=2751274 RepID=UPI001BE59426|nr:DUF817 domain-containing protein [Exiguobacterium sp. s63]
MGRIRYLFIFAYEQALSCIFPVAIFGALAVTKFAELPLPRYDVLLIWCLFVQVILVKTGLETMEEVRVISWFHVIGLGLELFKVQMGSWSYPDEAFTKVWGVPLYAGFMYASVGSYVVQAWRRLDLRFTKMPNPIVAFGLGIAIYFNFFWHHVWLDLRWLLIALIFLAFGRSIVSYKLDDRRFNMPVVLSFFLIACFIWLAENIVTFYNGWAYPDQMNGWAIVDLGKLSSWFLLVIISILLVAWQKRKLEYETT